MASIISAGTTSGTSLNLSGDTSGVLQLATNGSTTAVTITTAQNVGIGTASPAYALDVRSTAAPAIRLSRSGTAGQIASMVFEDGNAALGSGSTTRIASDSGEMSFSTGGTSGAITGGTERMRIDSSGKILRGKTTSDSASFVQSLSSNTTTLSSNYFWSGLDQGIMLQNSSSTTNAGVGISFWMGANNNASAGILGFQETANSTGALAFFTGGQGVSSTVPERMRIDSSGNVGIGTSSPSGRLHVAQSGSDINPTLEATTAGYAVNLQLVGNNAAGSRYNNITCKYGSTEQWYIGGNGSDATIAFRTGSASTERMRIDSSGNLIMASNAGYLGLPTNQTMRVPSTGGIGYVGNINSATVFQIAYNSTSAGVQLSSGATSWGTFSDSRLKNITGTYTNALNDIAQIQPVKFTWKSDENSKPQVGVIAQSVENVVPEAVDSTTIEMDGTEKYLTVRYTELIPLMIASIQELKAELDATKAEVQALKGVN